MKAVGNYLIEKVKLGNGQYGEVYRAHLKTDVNQKYAVKIINKKKLDTKLFAYLRNEIVLLSKIDSPNVVRLYDLQRTENNFYLIMDYCNGLDLEKLKMIRKNFREVDARLILQQIVQGFKEIYKHRVMHRDLKLANILLHFNSDDFDFDTMKDEVSRSQQRQRYFQNVDLSKTSFLVKIADLGFAKELGYEDLSSTQCGTPLIMAPEILNGNNYNHKADVWSLGVVFFEMLTGFTPFNGNDKPDLIRNLTKGDYMLPKKIKLSLQGLDFLNCCLQHNQEMRMSWTELVNHPYITSDPRMEKPEEELKLQYSEIQGQYMADEMSNSRNAIILNCRDPGKYMKVYEEVLTKHFKQQQEQRESMINQHAQQVKQEEADIVDRLKLSMARFDNGEEEKSDDEMYFDVKDQIVQPQVNAHHQVFEEVKLDHNNYEQDLPPKQEIVKSVQKLEEPYQPPKVVENVKPVESKVKVDVSKNEKLIMPTNQLVFNSNKVDDDTEALDIDQINNYLNNQVQLQQNDDQFEFDQNINLGRPVNQNSPQKQASSIHNQSPLKPQSQLKEQENDKSCVNVAGGNRSDEEEQFASKFEEIKHHDVADDQGFKISQSKSNGAHQDDMSATLVERPRDEEYYRHQNPLYEEPVDVVKDSIFPQLMKPDQNDQQAILFDQQQEEDVSINFNENYF